MKKGENEMYILTEKFKHALYLAHLSYLKIPIKTKTNSNRIFLFGTPNFINYGDLAIFQAEINFLKMYFPEKEIISISEPVVERQLPIVKKIINSTDVIAIHGGGNMYGMYEFQNKMRIEIIKLFRYNRIVSFPQSTDYSLKKLNTFNELKSLLKKRRDVFFFARDTSSFSFLKDNLQKEPLVGLTPDIVLTLNVNKKLKRKNYITTFLRKDKEKLQNVNMQLLLSKIEAKYKVVNSDTEEPYWNHIITHKSLNKLINRKLSEFMSSKLVITDRLHGMIFSVITGTPAIVFDNANHKIKHAYDNWFSDISYIYYADSYSNLNKIVDQIMKNPPEKYKIPNYKKEYVPLINALTI